MVVEDHDWDDSSNDEENTSNLCLLYEIDETNLCFMAQIEEVPKKEVESSTSAESSTSRVSNPTITSDGLFSFDYLIIDIYNALNEKLRLKS